MQRNQFSGALYTYPWALADQGIDPLPAFERRPDIPPAKPEHAPLGRGKPKARQKACAGGSDRHAQRRHCSTLQAAGNTR